jgi:NAD(P)-dependent dehydrogenase (short-subunit alcohol dehydrogenase family)
MSQSALITGGTGGLGSAVVQLFLDTGWRVVVPWVVEAELERVPEHDRLELIQADLFDPDSVETVVSAAVGPSDAPFRAVVNLVGGFSAPGRVHEAPFEDFKRQLALNLEPTYLVVSASLPHLIASGGGSIVCVSARPALEPFSGAAGYITAKAGVLAFARAVATEYKHDGVRCNAILPSVIDTPGNRASQPDADFSRWVKPEEIAGVVRFLCSDESAPISGAAVPVYGRA